MLGCDYFAAVFSGKNFNLNIIIPDIVTTVFITCLRVLNIGISNFQDLSSYCLRYNFFFGTDTIRYKKNDNRGKNQYNKKIRQFPFRHYFYISLQNIFLRQKSYLILNITRHFKPKQEK